MMQETTCKIWNSRFKNSRNKNQETRIKIQESRIQGTRFKKQDLIWKKRQYKNGKYYKPPGHFIFSFHRNATF